MDYMGMAYEVEVERIAVKALQSIDQTMQRRILAKIRSLGENPRPDGATKLTGADGWRVRVGDYRIVYRINDMIQIVNVTRIGHRRDIYRGM